MRANKCLITHIRDRDRNAIPLFKSRNVYFFLAERSQSAGSAALISPHCSARGISSGLMREQRKAYKDGAKFARPREQRHCFPGLLDRARAQF